jgi:hypothetical protein
MPTPIPTNYVLALDPLLGFTNGGTAWLDQSIGENNFTFNNTSYVYENTIGSFYLNESFETSINEDIRPGTLPIGTSAISIIAWIKIVNDGPDNSNFAVFQIGRNPAGTDYQMIALGNSSTGPFSGNYYQYLTVNNNSGYRVANAPADSLPFDTWVMVSYTKPASGTVASQKLYIDGVEISSYSTVNGTGVVNTSLAAGSSAMVRINNFDPVGVRTTTSGSIGQVWIYDQVLSGADMLNFYEQTQPRYYPAPPVIDLSNGRSFQQGFNG